MADHITEKVSGKLDVVISLLQDIKEALSGKEETVKNKVGYLSSLGLDNKEIAKIVRISEKHVSKEKTLFKKKNG